MMSGREKGANKLCSCKSVRRVTVAWFVFILLAVLGTAQMAAIENPIPLPQDSNGWTVFTPSPDSRIMYVSIDGNDASGRVYSPHDLSNPFDPGNVESFATFSAAFAQTRDGFPDWVLLRRGDEFSANISPRSGRNASELSLIGSYGASGPMPIIYPAASGAMLDFLGTREYVAVVGIDFYARGRDPNSPHYPGIGGTGIDGVSTRGRPIHYILFEGCRFRFFAHNGLQSYDGPVGSIVMRRTSILSTYSGGGGHSQGLFASGIDGILLEENIFDHNGWYSQAPGAPGMATMFNHNTYFEDCHNVTFRRNIFTRPSSAGNKWTANQGAASSTNLRIVNNLYVDGEVGIGIGGNTFGPDRFQNIEIEGNVFTEMNRSRPTDRNLRWGLEVVGWYGGHIRNNYFLHYNEPNMDGNIYAITLQRDVRDVVIDGNVTYNLNPHGNSSIGRMLYVQFRSGSIKQNIIVTNNILHEPVNSLWLIEFASSNDIGGFSFSDNQYFSLNHSMAFRVEGSRMGMDNWAQMTGDNSVFGEPTHPDPTRSIETYAQSPDMRDLGLSPTIDAFIEAVRAQNRYNWDHRLTAAAVNAWIKDGFDRPEQSGGSPPVSPSLTPPSGLRIIE